MRKIFFITAIILFSFGNATAQNSNPMVNQRWNIFDINKVKTKFNNTGELCDGNEQNFSLARPPAFEYPAGSGYSWGTCVGVSVGAPLDQDSGAVGGWPNPADNYYAFCDATMDEGPAAFWDEEHFYPYAEFVGGNGACMSDDTTTWPAVWPTTYPVLGDPVLRDSVTGWPGFGKNGKQLADQESFSVVEAWGGTDQLTATGRVYPNFLRTQMIIHGMAWKGTLYENFIVWAYVVRNIGDAPIHDMRVAIHADFSFIPEFYPGIGYDADRHYYDPQLQLAYGTDDDGYEESPFGGTIPPDQIPYAGVVVLRMPGGDNKVKTYDAFHFWMQATTPAGNGARPDWYFEYNVMNLNDPQDSDGDGIDDDFDGDGIPDVENGGPNYYLGLGADGLQTLGSAAFTLNPGEADTLIFATVFGTNEKNLKENAKRAIVLYENDWEIVDAPPAPVLEAIPDDGKIKLVWSNNSENDPQFEGYKIYRSSDGGVTWGEQSFKDFDGGVHYIPLKQFDLEDGITGNYSTIPRYAWFYLGDDDWSQLREVVSLDDNYELFEPGDTVNIFIDNNVVNGLRYKYYVAAYDSGNGIIGPLENGFSNNPSEINNTAEVIARAPVARKSLDNVRVVPNPYHVAALWEQGQNEHLLQFTNMPEKATIRIFNSSGELIKTIHHDASNSFAPSIATWDLHNEYNQLVSAGVYFYHISSKTGVKTGKIFIVL
jgi:hypothetical protein